MSCSAEHWYYFGNLFLEEEATGGKKQHWQLLIYSFFCSSSLPFQEEFSKVLPVFCTAAHCLLLPIDATFSCVLVENVKINAEGQLIGEKSRMPMANAKVQHRKRASISTYLVVIPYNTIFTKHCEFPWRAEAAYRVGLMVMDG